MGRRRGGTEKNTPNDVALSHERLLWAAGYEGVAGVDEVGLGPWAGPVVAAAVVFPPHADPIWGIDDSKKLAAPQRETLGEKIRAVAVVSIGLVDVGDIDSGGVHRAGLEAMRRAVEGLRPEAEFLIVDAREVPEVKIRQAAFVRADSFVYSVAAASIVAKVHRDAIMRDMERRYPGYGFDKHMGYGTAAHTAALESLGPCAIHRRSFAPVRRLLETVKSA
jgi:ribonuclease HII